MDNKIYYIKYFSSFILLITSLIAECESDYTEINNLCFHAGDISFIQEMIDNSYQSGIDLGCQDGDSYCGSPNPYMDSQDNWGWISYDGVGYDMPGNENGFVEPLELGIQEWEDGRLTSLMCGAYIYCQLSGPIPQEVNQLSNLSVLLDILSPYYGAEPIVEYLISWEHFHIPKTYICHIYIDI